MTEDPAPPSKPADPATDAFIRHALETRQKLTPKLSYPTLEPNERSRRTAFAGVMLGGIASLIIALLSQVVNPLLTFGVRMNASPFLTLLNFLMIMILGTVLSLVAVASIKIQNWIIGGGLALVGLYIIYWLNRLIGNIAYAVILGMIFIFLFIIPLLVIILILLRWAVNVQVRYFFKPVIDWKRAVPVLILLTAVLFAGNLFIFSASELSAIRSMDEMTRDAMVAQTEENLPIMIQQMRGAPFSPNARGKYYLLAQHNPIPKRVLPNGTPYLMDIYVSAQFENGYWFTCRYTSNGLPVDCYSRYTPPIPNAIGMIECKPALLVCKRLLTLLIIPG